MKAYYKKKVDEIKANKEEENALKLAQKCFDAQIDQVYGEVRNDVAAQILAVVCCYLNKEYRWTGKTLNKMFSGVQSYLHMMLEDKPLGKHLTTDDCIKYMASLGVDVEKFCEYDLSKDSKITKKLQSSETLDNN